MKWFVPEVLSEEALRLLDGNHELLAPDLLIPECGNVLWKRISRNELRAGEGREILQALGRAPVRIVESQALVEAALEIATAFRRTVYDALYVALAVARDCVLVTGDDRLARALATGPLRPNVRSLEHWDRI
jgi:predicted nucleic acid-binding protein